ncbi:MAG TPA: tetratricopeptide repeat protein, partial [Candidatus Paceibacterota bacterium]|nr:tetratricopeptide repeat protein [Candidatus Paceibacterota bacterium]
FDDARDGFELAAQSVELRGAAWTELAKLALHAGDLARSKAYAERSLGWNQRNLDARQLMALVLRLEGRRDEARATLDALHELDPLNAFGEFEKALADGGEAARRAFVGSIRNEMPQETYLELAVWYHGLNRPAEAGQVLQLAPQTAEVLYWRARLETHEAAAIALLKKAEEASPERVFPFRGESAEVLRWAASRSSSWRPPYYLALIHWGAGNLDEARRLFSEIGEKPDYAPFYAARSLIFEQISPERSLADLEQAARRDPAQWRFGKMLVDRHLRQGKTAIALETARRYSAQSPDHYILGMLLAKALIANGRYPEADECLTRLRVLPYEGGTEGRRLYRETKLMLAVEDLRKGNPVGALASINAARLWPENLGTGKPYPANVDECLEDFLAAECLLRRGESGAAGKMLEQITTSGGRQHGASPLIRALALRRMDRADEGRKLLHDWNVREPENTLATWAVRAYDGTVGPSPEAAAEEGRVLAAWLGTAQP